MKKDQNVQCVNPSLLPVFDFYRLSNLHKQLITAVFCSLFSCGLIHMWSSEFSVEAE